MASSSLSPANLKYVSLVVLVVQTTVLVLTMRYSRAVRSPHEPLYLASTAVVMAEVRTVSLPATLRTLSSSLKCFSMAHSDDQIPLSFLQVFKFVCSFLLLWWERWSANDSYGIVPYLRSLREDLTRQPLEMLKLAVPALLYTVQNNLLYVALSNLDAATYQVSS